MKPYFLYKGLLENNLTRRELCIFSKSDFINKVLNLTKKEIHG